MGTTADCAACAQAAVGERMVGSLWPEHCEEAMCMVGWAWVVDGGGVREGS